MLAIVPARSGSKGVPGKNIALIGGIPVIHYTIAALEAAACVSAIILTTDDPAILGIYRNREGTFTIDRPPELANDEATTASVIRHALHAWKDAGQQVPDALLLAQPTTPLRVASDIEGAFGLFKSKGGPSLISACRAEGIRHPRVMYRVESGDLHGSPFMATAEPTRRQEYENVYQRNGAIYMVATEFFNETGLMRNDTPLIYEMPWERSINIDVPGDLLIAKALIESGLVSVEPSP